MNNIIKITDIPKASLVRNILKNDKRDLWSFNTSCLYAAIEIMKGYKYNIEKGTLSNGKEIVSEYSNKKDIPFYSHAIDTIEEFTGFISNNALQLKNENIKGLI